MKENYKKLYGYAIIMIVCVLIIVLVVALSDNRLKGYQTEYEEEMTTGQKQIQMLEDQIVALSEENAELKKELAQSQKLGSDLVTAEQAMSDLKDIYQMYKSGKGEEAKALFDKIEPMGFDDATLDYYEVLKDLLNK